MAFAEPTNITSLVGLLQYANEVTNNKFVALLLITTYLVPFIYMINKNPDDWIGVSMVSGFFCAITAILLRVAEITTSDKYIFFAIATIVIPMVIKLLKDRNTI